MIRHLLALSAALAFPLAAFVQDAAPVPPKGFSGAILSVNGDAVTLQNKDGQKFTVQMTPGWTVSANRKGTPNDIKPGDFVATTNVPVTANSGRSTEVRILEPGYRPEEGTHAVSATDANMMTHGTVKSADKNDAGVELQITYSGGSRLILVPQDAPVTISDALDKSVLQPGVAVSGVTRPGPDGTPLASRLQLQSQ